MRPYSNGAPAVRREASGAAEPPIRDDRPRPRLPEPSRPRRRPHPGRDAHRGRAGARRPGRVRPPQAPRAGKGPRAARREPGNRLHGPRRGLAHGRRPGGEGPGGELPRPLPAAGDREGAGVRDRTGGPSRGPRLRGRRPRRPDRREGLRAAPRPARRPRRRTACAASSPRASCSTPPPGRGSASFRDPGGGLGGDRGGR